MCLRTAADNFAIAAIMAAEKLLIAKLSQQVDDANELMRLIMPTRPRPMKPTRLKPMKPTRLMSTTSQKTHNAKMRPRSPRLPTIQQSTKVNKAMRLLGR